MRLLKNDFHSMKSQLSLQSILINHLFKGHAEKGNKRKKKLLQYLALMRPCACVCIYMVDKRGRSLEASVAFFALVRSFV